MIMLIVPLDTSCSNDTRETPVVAMTPEPGTRWQPGSIFSKSQVSRKAIPLYKSTGISTIYRCCRWPITKYKCSSLLIYCLCCLPSIPSIFPFPAITFVHLCIFNNNYYYTWKSSTMYNVSLTCLQLSKLNCCADCTMYIDHFQLVKLPVEHL